MACPCCGEPTKLTCPSCKSIHYCSPECKETDVPSHSLLCSQHHLFLRNAPLSATSVRCIVFPSQGDIPIYRWLEVKEVRGNDGRLLYKQPNMVKLLGTEEPHCDYITTNEITGAKLPLHIHLCYHDDAEQRYDEENAAVKRATGGLANASWRGTIVAYRGVPDDADHPYADIQELENMTPTAYSHVIAHLVDHKNDDPDYLVLKGPKVQAVRIRANASTARGENRFEAVSLPRMHPLIGSEGEMGAISKRVGMPLRCIKISASGDEAAGNEVGSCMHISLDPSEKPLQRMDPVEVERRVSKGETIDGLDVETRKIRNEDTGEEQEVPIVKLDSLAHGKGGFGRASPYWTQEPVGDVVIFRNDFKPLTIDTIQAFVVFCKCFEMTIRYAAGKNGKVGADAEIDVLDDDCKATWVSAVSEEEWVNFLKGWKSHSASIFKEFQQAYTVFERGGK